jgi:predicted nuclease of predicted toxin-antitoxin system
VNFLIDNQLPAALARFLVEREENALHVLDLGMDEASDIQLWGYAIQHSMILISKDEDFFHLANRSGDTGRLLWVRLGNCRNHALIGAFEQKISVVLTAYQQGHRIVEIR